MLLPFEKHWASFISYPTRDRRVARPKLLLKKSVQTCVPRSSPLLAKAGQLPRQNPVPSPEDSNSFFSLPTVQPPQPAQQRRRLGTPVKRWAIIFRARGAGVVPVSPSVPSPTLWDEKRLSQARQQDLPPPGAPGSPFLWANLGSLRSAP